MAIIALTGKAGSGKDTVASIVQELYPEMNWQIKGFADKLRQVASLLTGIPAEDIKKQEVKEQFLDTQWDTSACTHDKLRPILEASMFKDGIQSDGMEDGVPKWLKDVEKLGWTPPFPYKPGVIYTRNDFFTRKTTLRQFLQKLGTEAIRDGLHPQAWINALMCDYKPRKKEGGFQRIVYHCGHPVDFEREVEYPNWLITDCRFPNELEAIKSRGGTCFRIVRPDNPYPKSNHESETALDGVELLTIINDGSLEQLRLRLKEVFDTIVKNLGK